MAFRLTFQIAAPMETVLAAMRDDCREWRESVIPPGLRDRHVFQIVGEIRRRRFTWYYDCGGWDGCPIEQLRGQVDPHPDGSSTLTVWCGVPRTSWHSALRWASVWGGIVVVMAVLDWGGISSSSELWPLVRMAANVTAFLWGATMLSSWLRPDTDYASSEPAQYLVERLRGVIRKSEDVAAGARRASDQAV